MNIGTWASIINLTICFAVPLMLVALGGMYSERSGIINLALEGIMIMGALAACLLLQILDRRAGERAAASWPSFSRAWPPACRHAVLPAAGLRRHPPQGRTRPSAAPPSTSSPLPSPPSWPGPSRARASPTSPSQPGPG